VRQQNEQTVQAKHADGRLVITKSVTYSLFTNCNDKIPNSIAPAEHTAEGAAEQFAEQTAEQTAEGTAELTQLLKELQC
jgi:hypothetical protein